MLDELRDIAVADGLDALIVQRDLSTYPIYKRVGNWVMSSWASLWAGHRLRDVESGYRIFRAAALADALDYYQGYKYSETVEVAVVLCRLGYRVRNDVMVPVPTFRSRTRLVDDAIDLAMIPLAAYRASESRRGCAHRSLIMRAERANLKSRRDDLRIAQGTRGTSAALGCGWKMISSFFPSGLARRRRAKPETPGR